MRVNEARHQTGIEEIRRSYDKELLRLQSLLTKRQAAFSNVGLIELSKEEKDLKGEDYNFYDKESTPKEIELEKEIALQNHLIEGFQKENEALMKENKDLKQKLASTLIPSEDANAIAERLVHENARLQIDFQQVKDELNALKSAQDLASKKGEKDRSHSEELLLNTDSKILKKRIYFIDNNAQDIQEELEKTIRRLEEESCQNRGFQDSLCKLEAEVTAYFPHKLLFTKLKQTKEEQSRLQELLSTSDSKWAQEVKDRQRRIVALNAELRRVRQDHIVAMQTVQEKMRWQNHTQTISSRHLSTIKKQKLKMLKFKTELEKKQSVPSARSEMEDHDFADNPQYSTPVRELQMELRASHQRVSRLETQLNTLSRVHMALITGKSPNEALQWDCGIGERKSTHERIPNIGRPVNMEDESCVSYWRAIAEKRTNDVALLSKEVDKLTNLLEEISTRIPPATGLSIQLSEEGV
ncbi:unnamed protein product [Hydatigera taeniaeformis]|uniref:Cerebellar degeneration-related protein 2-like n=1 Tax=Hydatigena taeniaeformis TaxID=6205 RepID=A0A0R3X4H2_HYDTA|nr:unnamed protein product [Hydatigera taeniaeformis]